MLIKRKSIEKEESQRPARKPAAPRKPKYSAVTLSEHDGMRYLHFGTEWIQGAMRLRKPDWLELEYVQQMMSWMLFIEQPQHIAQLGLGSASLTKFCYRQFPLCKITAIELNPSVISICETMFKLPPNDERLHVAEMDAYDFVNDPANLESLDVLQVDLYDANANGPVLDSAEFYRSCSACLKEHGIMMVNLFGDHPSFNKNIKAMDFSFAQVISLPEVPDGNVIAIAFKQKPKLDFTELYARATQITTSTKLPAKSWVNGLK
jgi:spermidine synthase